MKNGHSIEGNIARIMLRRGGRKGTQFMEAIIDSADFARADEMPGTWVVKWNPTAHTFYARANKPNVYLHRWLLRIDEPKIQVDHEDHDGLNNRRYNLKPTCVKGNGFNRRGAEIGSTSGRRNVYWNEREKKWMVWTVYMGKRYYAGYYADLEEADEAAKKLRAQAVVT